MAGSEPDDQRIPGRFLRVQYRFFDSFASKRKIKRLFTVPAVVVGVALALVVIAVAIVVGP